MKAPERFDRSEDYLHEVAIKTCGLTDFGDPGYLMALRVLLASMDANPRFTPEGRQLAWDALIMTLVARAYAEKGWKDYPEWRDYKISKPILITGLPRTGTTALHKLMGTDPQFQGVQNWLTTAPMPRPPFEEWATNPNFLRAMRWIHKQHEGSPDSAISHRVAADELDEDLELQRQTFVSNRWASTWYSAGYDAWWTTQDERPSFIRAFDLLKLIGCHDQDKRWLLKNPGSMGMFDWLFECAPDACVIQTHRDPVKATASICSTLQHIHVAFEGADAEIPRRLLGPRELEKWAGMLDRGAPFRARHESRFMDVYHADFHAHPMRVIGEIYDRFGLHLSAEVEQRMVARIKENPEGQGAHNYDLDSFGLTREMILERHRGYMQRYGLTA
ncbi:MAG: sulfotransferase [Georgfuchsia sp.]